MGLASNFLTVATLGALGFFWMAQGSKTAETAPPPPQRPSLAAPASQERAHAVRPSPLPDAGLSPAQRHFAQSCVSTMDSTIAFAALGLEKGTACVCMAQMLRQYGVQPAEEIRDYRMAGDMMAMTVARAVAREKHSDREIRESLLQRYPDMKRKITWMRGALFAAFAHCAEQDETASGRIDALRKLMGR